MEILLWPILSTKLTPNKMQADIVADHVSTDDIMEVARLARWQWMKKPPKAMPTTSTKFWRWWKRLPMCRGQHHYLTCTKRLKPCVLMANPDIDREQNQNMPECGTGVVPRSASDWIISHLQNKPITALDSFVVLNVQRRSSALYSTYFASASFYNG